jgi:ABC-type uncharacterized transport system fused permease/ATPase subunit
MKCEVCSKKITKDNFWAGIKYDISKRVFGSLTELFLLSSWIVTGKFHKILDKKTQYMHFSCFQNQPWKKKWYYIHPITYTRGKNGKIVSIISIMLIPIIMFFVYNFIKHQFTGSIIPFNTIFFVMYLCIFFLFIVQFILLTIAGKYIKKKIKFD